MIFRAWMMASVLVLAFAAYAEGPAAPYGYGLDGEPVARLAATDTQAVVLFFTATDCPISNRYIPEIQRLENEFAAQHVAFWYAYPNVGETANGVRKHEDDYGTEEHVLLDPHHRLVALTHAKITPEAVILIPRSAGSDDFRVVYLGRIDNRYIHFGLQRPRATQHDLEAAIADVLQHHPVHQPSGPPVGCTIVGQQ
jgi:AhpC/TSA family